MRSRWLAWLLSPIGLLLLSAARLLIISDYSTTTAVTIASSGGYVNTLLGSVIPLLPIFMPYIALILLLARQYVLSILSFVFVIFISPTELKVPVTRRSIRFDLSHISILLHHYWVPTLAVGIVIAIAVRRHHRSSAEAIGVLIAIVVVVLLFTLPLVSGLHFPTSIRAAHKDEYAMLHWLRRYWIDSVLIALVAIILFEFYRRGVAEKISTLTALVLCVALIPYVINVYPLPSHSYYYFTVLHQPWLPAEHIKLSTGKSYNAYVLASDDNWFTVLTASGRSIVYIPTDKIVSRAVCAVPPTDRRAHYAPLVTSLYSRPAQIPPCRNRR
jgi:hypothetical protein